MSYKMTNEELANAIRSYFDTHGNHWCTSSDVHEMFLDQDKVRFQLAFSNMYLKPPHLLVKRDNPTGRGAEWRLRTSEDGPFVPPVKVPRKKRVELEGTIAAPAPEPLTPSRISHRDVGMVAETPAIIRKHDPDTMPVAHRALGAPANNAMAEALAKIKPQVAAFKRDTPYEIPKAAKVETVPFGVHSASAKAKGDAPLPAMVMAGVIEKTNLDVPQFLPVDAVKEQGDLHDLADEAGAEPTPPADLLNPALGTAAQLFQSMLALAAPALKNLIRDAMIEALTHESVAAILNPPEQERIEVGGQELSKSEMIELIASDRRIPRKHNPEMPSSDKKLLPRVCVLGLPKPSHEQALKKEFYGQLDVRTISVDLKPHQIVSACNFADHVVFLSDHSNHKAAYALQSAGIEFDRITGGIQKASDYLRNVVEIHK